MLRNIFTKFVLEIFLNNNIDHSFIGDFQLKKNFSIGYQLFLCLIILSVSLYSQENDSLKNTIFINSDPVGAEVFLNKSLIGKTPFTLKNQVPGKFDFQIKLDENNSYSETVHYNGDQLELYPLFNSDHSELDIVTNPDNALIYVNDSLLGTTPIYNLIIPLGLQEIKIEKDDYIKYERKYNFQKKKIKWNYKLNYKFGYVNSNLNDSDITLKINGNQVYNIDRQFIKTEIGTLQFDLIWKNEKSISKLFKIESGKYYSAVYKTDYFTPIYLLESTIVPGLGQFSDESKIKGLLFFLTNATLGYLYLNEDGNYKDRLSIYNSAKKNYMEAKNENESIMLREIMEQELNKVNSSVDKKNIYLGLVIGAYLLNLIDVFIFHTDGFDMELNEINNQKYGNISPQFKIKYSLN